VAQLSIVKPFTLTVDPIAGVLAAAVALDLPDCNQFGLGTLSWLIQLDEVFGLLTTGGAKPAKDPTAGYCFVDEVVAGLLVAPSPVPMTLDAGGGLTVEPIALLNLPIYQDSNGRDATVVPLRQLRISATTVSSDRSCIGTFNAEGLRPAGGCKPTGGTQAFVDRGFMQAHILLEEADKVTVQSLGQSLCCVLSGDPSAYCDSAVPSRCARIAGAILFKGDWCSITDSAGGCQDAVVVEATFAASGVTLRDDC
jgi:hypothetical protein